MFKRIRMKKMTQLVSLMMVLLLIMSPMTLTAQGAPSGPTGGPTAGDDEAGQGSAYKPSSERGSAPMGIPTAGDEELVVEDTNDDSEVAPHDPILFPPDRGLPNPGVLRPPSPKQANDDTNTTKDAPKGAEKPPQSAEKPPQDEVKDPQSTEATSRGEEIALRGDWSFVPGDYLPEIITGTAQVIESWNQPGYSPFSNHQSGMAGFPNVFNAYVTTAYGSRHVFNLWCQESGALAPTVGLTGLVTLTFSHYDAATNEFVYFVYVAFDIGWQDIGDSVMRLPGPKAHASLFKQSSNPDLSNGNNQYSLAGAVYEVYTASGTQVGVLITNEAGRSNQLRDLPLGIYYVKETKAPLGFVLDKTLYYFLLGEAGQEYVVRTFDSPVGDTYPLSIKKLDASTGEAHGLDDPQGFMLAGAQFTLHYYYGYYDSVEEAQASGAPARTWILETKVGGTAKLLDNKPRESYLVSGSDPLYRNTDGSPMIPLGTVLIQETKAPDTYLLPDPAPVTIVTVYLDTSGRVARTITTNGASQEYVELYNTLIVKEEPRLIKVRKIDAETGSPILRTEFTLYRKRTPGADNWQTLLTKVTDEDGYLVYAPMPAGSYKLVETRPHQAYASLDESGDGAYYFEVTELTDYMELVIENHAIQISCDIYKDTINITSAAFKTFDEDYLQVNNIGIEEFGYKIGFRSTSNVRADEFTVVDPMESALAGQVRLTQLWTPVVYGDTDGLFNLWYQTNLTDPDVVYSTANAMDSNPFNPNNPHNKQVYPSTGWLLWAQGLSTTETTQLFVEDLALAVGEYITGVRYEYGSVEAGFTTGNGLIETLQEWKPTLNWGSHIPFLGRNGNRAGAPTDLYQLYPAYYLVVCPEGIEPPEEIMSTAHAQIARNIVLTDYAEDYVVTTTIVSFMLEVSSDIPEDDILTTWTPEYRIPQTGDGLSALLTTSLVMGVIAVGLILAGIWPRIRGKRRRIKALTRSTTIHIIKKQPGSTRTD